MTRNKLIVMRLAEMRVTHPAQDNARVCSECGEKVGIYPSGQRVIAAKPDIAIVCNVCSAAARHFDVAISAPGAIEEAREQRRRQR